MTRIVAAALAVCLTAVAGASHVTAQEFVHPTGAFAFAPAPGWSKDEESADALAIKCGRETCADEDGWCEAKVSKPLSGRTSADFFGQDPKAFDTAFRSAGGDEGAFRPTVAYERRAVGGKDGFYGEYELTYVKREGTLAVVRLQAFNRERIVDLTCMALPENLPIIRGIVEAFRLPS